MENLMSLQPYIRQLRPRNESYIPHVERVQNLFEAKGLDLSIVQNTIPGSQTLRGQVLIDAIKNGTSLETTKGSVVLNWISDSDRITAEGGDWATAFKKGPSYKNVFVTDSGDKLKLNKLKFLRQSQKLKKEHTILL